MLGGTDWRAGVEYMNISFAGHTFKDTRDALTTECVEMRSRDAEWSKDSDTVMSVLPCI